MIAGQKDLSEEEGLAAGAIAGIVIAALVVVALIVGGVYYYLTKSNVKKPRKPQTRVDETNM